MGKRGEEETDVGYLFCDMVLAEYVAMYDAGLCCLCNVVDSRRKNCVTVVYVSIAGEKSDEALC